MSPAPASAFEALSFYNEPASSDIKEGRLSIIARPEVDWWRNPEPVRVNRKDGPFLYLKVDGSRDFRCQVWLRSSLIGLYDQACLVLHGGDLKNDNSHWLKTGTETFDDRQWINCVAATPFCDVSTVLAARSMATGDNGEWLYLDLTKERSITGHTILIRYAVRPIPDVDCPPNDKEMANLREIQAFGVNDRGERSQDTDWSIGVMVSGLMNPEGAKGEFEGFRFTYL